MVRIRLRRVGAKNQPSYRIVVTDSRSPRDGRFIEKIGFYNPRTEPAMMEVDEARALYWLDKGAQPSNAVKRIFVKLGTMDRFERLRAGESLDILLAEVEAAAEASGEVDPRTRRDDLGAAPKKKPAAKVEEPHPEPEPVPDEDEVEEIEAAADEPEAEVAIQADEDDEPEDEPAEAEEDNDD